MIPLQATDLTMKFKDKLLFHIPKLQLRPHEAVYLRGDNGVGKTTLLKILSGLISPTAGQLSHRQSWLSHLMKPNKFGIVYLHQSPYLFDASVYQNILYAIKYSKLSRQEKRAQVINALRKVGLETLADEHISVLSGGEKQRIAMARAWVTKPNILLMDEPSANLDLESISRLTVLAKELLENGASLVITSHQQNELTQLCSKQWWMKNHTLIESSLLYESNPLTNVEINMLKPENIEWVILAGGQATRMGNRDKGLVELDGKPLVEYVISALKSQTNSITINANRSQDKYQQYATVISDYFNDFPGPLGGIHAGLSQASQDWVGFVPCDSPNIPDNLAETFCSAWTKDADILVAHDGDYYQPVFALFHRRVLHKLQDFLERGERKIVLFYEDCHVVQVDFSAQKEMFINLNTFEQLSNFSQDQRLKKHFSQPPISQNKH